MPKPPPNQLLVFTDLDGTLLGHENYDFECNLPLIGRLKDAGIPLVLATSKTEAEVMVWQDRLGLDGPIMVENGSLIKLPRSQYSEADLEDVRFITTSEHFSVELGTPLPKLEHFLRTVRQETGITITSFVHSSVEEAMQMTGLTRADAARAQRRAWSLPLVIRSDEETTALETAADREGFRTVRGGRFLHLQGPCDKRDAMVVIAAVESKRRGCAVTTLALGDNQNDAAMLAAADQPIIMNTANGYRVTVKNKNAIRTTQPAPLGWQEGLGIALETMGRRDLTHG